MTGYTGNYKGYAMDHPYLISYNRLGITTYLTDCWYNWLTSGSGPEPTRWSIAPWDAAWIYSKKDADEVMDLLGIGAVEPVDYRTNADDVRVRA